MLASYPFEVRHRDVWSIALPATLAFITEPLAGLVDLTVIGRLGDADLLGGLVLGNLTFTFIFVMMNFLRMGTAGLVAQSVGARDADEGLRHLGRACLAGLAIGLLVAILTVPILWLAGLLLAPDDAVRPAFETYVAVRFWSGPMALMNFALLGWFYGRADAAVGMALQILIHGTNIVLSILFVHGFGWGIAGVALGTVIAQSVAMAAGLALVIRHYGGMGRAMRHLSPAALVEPVGLWRMVALSRDLLIRSAALQAAFGYFTAQMSREGAVLLSANAIILNFQMVTAFFLDGQAQAAEQLCGKAVGANHRPAFEKAMRLGHLWGFILGSGLFLVWIGLGPFLIDLMTTAPDVRDAARTYLFIGSFTAVTGVMAFVMDGVMTGATLNTTIRNGMVVAFIVFLIAALILEPLFGLNGLWVALHIFFVVRGVIFWFAVRIRMPGLFPATT